jgi:cob(I)alamin adenosyltransferase
MVRLDRIYTRGGDTGMTSLGNGKRVPKTHPRIGAYGTVDELNCVLGLALRERGLGRAERTLLRRVQNDLFDLGADLAVPREPDEVPGKCLRITPAQVTGLEDAIDSYTAKLEPLRSFVLPGGTGLAAWLHVGRTVCRRAELQVAHLLETEREQVGEQTLVYLNRLADLLFVMARWTNDGGRADVLWEPGAGRPPEKGTAKKPPAAATRKSSRAKGRPRVPRSRKHS